MTRREYRDRVDTELRKVEERILLTADQNVYPGALLQGRNFENGNFAPITIPRMPGTITVQGLTLRPGSSLTRTVASPTGGEVGNAIADILNQAVGTAARFKFEESAANTTSKLLFDLGVDVRYGSASVNSTLNVNTSQNRNFAFLAFRQILYSVNFEPPASPVSVFRDGDGFQDPLNQIGPGNPPLYVSSVSYGRIVLFRAESEQSSSEIKAALEAAFKGGADVKVSSKLTAKQTLDASTLSYMVLGGNAAEALQPIAAADKFQAVRQFISNASAAQVSPSNPGLPIAYSLKYLKDNTDAMMVYSTGPYTASDITFADLEQKWSTMRQCRWEFSDPQDGDANDILVSSEWNSPTVPDGQVQFNLVAGPGITWYKGLRLMNRDTGGTFSEPFTQDGRTTSSILVPASFVNRLRAELMKAKFLGRHELVGSIGDGFQYVPPKTRVTFEWRRDSRNAPEVASSQNPKACRF
jgi:hypothetical protein